MIEKVYLLNHFFIINPQVRPALKAVVDVDAKAEKGVFLAPTTLPSKCVVFSSTGPLDKDYDDVRRSVSCQ